MLTHHPRDPLVMEGGTTFTFVTGGIRSALERAREVAAAGTVAIAEWCITEPMSQNRPLSGLS